MSALVLVALAVVVFGDLSGFRERAEKRASEALGVPVQIAGNMSLRPSLPPVIELDDVRIGNPDWAFHDDLLQVERVFLTLSLGAALTGDIEVNQIELDSFELILERHTSGEQNWPTQEGSGGVPIGTVVLTNGVMRWVDHDEGPFPEVEVGTLETALGATASSLEASVSIRGHSIDLFAQADQIEREDVSRWQVEARAEGAGWSLGSNGEVDADFNGQLSVVLKANELSVLNDLHGLAIPPLGPVSLDATITTSAHSVSASDLRIEVGENGLRGQLELSTAGPAPRLRAKLDTDHLQLADVWRYQSSTQTSTPGDYLDTTLPIVELAVSGIDADLTITAKALSYRDVSVGDANVHILSHDGAGELNATASVLGGDYKASLSARTDDGIPALTLRAKAAAIDLDDLAPVGRPLPVSGDKVSAELELSASGTNLRELLISLNGEVQIADVTLNHSSVTLGEQTLFASKLGLRASDGVLSAFDFDGKLGESSLLVKMGSARPIVTLAESGTWPLAGTIKYADVLIAIDGELESLEPPLYRGEFETSGPDVNTLGRLMGFALPPVAFRMKSHIEASAGKLALSNVSASLGASRFEGGLERVSDNQRVHYQGSLTATVLDPRDFQAFVVATNNDRWLPADVDGDLSLRVDKLAGAYQGFSAIALTASLNKSRLVVAPFALEWEGKPVRGELSIDENESPARLGVRLEADELDTSVLTFVGVETPGLQIDIGKLELDAQTRGHALPDLFEELSLQARVVDTSISYAQGALDTGVSSLTLDISTRPNESLIVVGEGIHENFPLELDLSVDSVSALIANQPIAVSATTRSSHASVHVSGSIDSPRDLDGVAVRLESQGTRFEILHPSLWLPWEQNGEFRLETDLEHVDHQLTLRNLDAVVAGNDLRGTVVIPTDADGRVAVKLESSSIAVGDVLEPEDDEEETVTVNARVIPSFPLANALPTQWSGDFEWKISWLQLDDSVFKNLNLTGQFEHGFFHLDQTGVTHPNNGPFSLSLTIDPSASPPAILKVAAEEFDLGWVLPNEADAKPHWPTDILVNLAGPAGNFQELLGGASGIIEISAGQTEGAEFEKWDLNLLSRMLPKLGAKSMDQINCLVMHMDVDNGMGTGDGAVMETQHAVVAGGGAVDLRTEKLGLLLSARPKDKTLLDVTASLQVEGTIGEPEVDLVSTDVAFGATQILLGVANPFALLGSFVLSSGDSANTACEAALKAAGEKGSGDTNAGNATSGSTGLFDLLFSGNREQNPKTQVTE